MNLRKDHSHASKRTTVHFSCEDSDRDGGARTDAPVWELAGSGVGLDRPPALFPLPSFSLNFSASATVTSSLVDLPLLKLFTTFSDGCLGSNNDEGRSEVR